MTTTKSRLGQALASGRLALTAECLPPPSSDAGAVKKLSSVLPPSLDAVVVADNPGGIHGSALACAAMLAGEGRPSVLSMVTRDRNRIALESDAQGAAALGVEAIFCLSGDHQSLGVCPQAAGVYDIDSIQLTQALKKMMREGPLPELPVGGAAHPYQQPQELNLLRLRKKIAAGADFVLTQAVFDLAGFTKWMDAVRAAGLDKRVAIIASVLPLTSVEQAQILARRRTYGPVTESVVARLSGASDPAKEGMAIAVEMAGQLKTIPGIRGIHILSGGWESSAATVIQHAGLA
jgi:methylenetetrahydrofolate reductase (NADPH)